MNKEPLFTAIVKPQNWQARKLLGESKWKKKNLLSAFYCVQTDRDGFSRLAGEAPNFEALATMIAHMLMEVGGDMTVLSFTDAVFEAANRISKEKECEKNAKEKTL